jgi:hypothetical protein
MYVLDSRRHFDQYRKLRTKATVIVVHDVGHEFG